MTRRGSGSRATAPAREDRGRGHRSGCEARADSRGPRIVGATIAATMLLWLAAQWAGPKLGLAGRYAFLIDLAALAAFLWSLVAAFRIWRGRRDE